MDHAVVRVSIACPCPCSDGRSKDTGETTQSCVECGADNETILCDRCLDSVCPEHTTTVSLVVKRRLVPTNSVKEHPATVRLCPKCTPPYIMAAQSYFGLGGRRATKSRLVGDINDIDRGASADRRRSNLRETRRKPKHLKSKSSKKKRR